MPFSPKDAAGLAIDLIRGKITLQDIAAKFDVSEIVKVATDTIGSINVDDVRNSILQSLSEKMSPVITIHPVKKLIDIDSSYLSLTKADELTGNLEGNEKLLEPIPDGVMSPYKDKSLMLIRALKRELEEYKKCFSVLTNGKILRLSRSKSIDYDKIWAAYKEMKKHLNNIKKLLEDFNRNVIGAGNKSVYSFEGFEEGLKQTSEVAKKALKEALAEELFVKAYKSICDRILSEGVANIEALKTKYKEDATKKSALDRECRLTIGVRNYTDRKNVPQFDATKKGGYEEECLAEAGEQLHDKLKLDAFAFYGLSAKAPFMGDYVVDLLACVDKTLKELGEVVNLGAKKDKVATSTDDLGVNLNTLLGDDHKKYVENLEKQKEVLSTAITKNLVRDMKSIHSKIEKEYKWLMRYKDKHFKPDSNDAPRQGEDFYDFSQFKVKMKTTKDDTDKEYVITERYEGTGAYKDKGLKDYYKNATGKMTNADDYVSLYVRKGRKFLKACEEWNRIRRKYEKSLEDRKVKAKEKLKVAKEHYNKLKGVPNLTKSGLSDLKKEYAKLPKFAFRFVKDYRGNVKAADEFCALSVDGNGNLQKPQAPASVSG